MGLYQYTAFTKNGKKNVGMVHADSIELAKEYLYKQKILVTKLVHYKKQGERLTLSSTLLLNFTGDMHALLKAGLPLHETLQILEKKYYRTKMHPLLLDLCDQVKRGCRFSDALREYPKVFDLVYISIVRAGEESGTLIESFEELTKLTRRERMFKKKIVSAMIYPAFLSILCLGVLGILFFFLIPSMAELFEGKTLHPITRAILYLSHIFNTHAVAIFAGIIGVLSSLLIFLHHPTSREKAKHLLFYIPIVKQLLVEMIIARFSRVFSVLCARGIPLIEGIRLAKKVIKYSHVERVFTCAEVKVAEGGRLSEELSQSPLIPSLVIRVLSIAEESGKVAEMMGHLSNIYEESVEKSLGRITALLQPAILLFLGMIIALILLSVLLPLTDVSAFVQ